MTLSDELTGRTNSSSLLPPVCKASRNMTTATCMSPAHFSSYGALQYLMTAMLTGAVHVTVLVSLSIPPSLRAYSYTVTSRPVQLVVHRRAPRVIRGKTPCPRGTKLARSYYNIIIMAHPRLSLPTVSAPAELQTSLRRVLDGKSSVDARTCTYDCYTCI